MGVRQLRTALAAVASVVALTLTGCSTNFSVEASPGGYQPFLPVPKSDDSGLRDEFELSPQESHEFWSDPNKLRDAEGMDFQAPDNGLSSGPGDPATGASRPATAPMPDSPKGLGVISDAETYDRAGLGASSFGRLYFSFDGVSLNVCSATVVNSDSGDIVVTAAHCVVSTDGKGTLAESMIFVPGDRNNAQEAPYGKWAAVSVSVPQEFVDKAITNEDGVLTSEEGWNYDFAFLKMEEQDGRSIQDVTGAQGIAFGIPTETLTQVGYPSAPPFDGLDEYVCASTDYSSNWQGGYAHACDMTQGSSGGGWLTQYDAESGTGYVVGVTSTVMLNTSTANASVLGQTALNLYRDLDGQS